MDSGCRFEHADRQERGCHLTSAVTRLCHILDIPENVKVLKVSGLKQLSQTHPDSPQGQNFTSSWVTCILWTFQTSTVGHTEDEYLKLLEVPGCD